MSGRRLAWQKSVLALRSVGIVSTGKGKPTDPHKIDTPRSGQAHQGLCLRDQVYEDVGIENLSLRRTLIERCRFHGVSFRNTDLGLSCLVADFIDCDFSDAVLVCTNLG